MIIMLQVHMSSSESGLSEDQDPMAVVSDDEVASAPEVFTSDTESDPEILSEDDDDFQPFALPDFGDDIPFVDDVLAAGLRLYATNLDDDNAMSAAPSSPVRAPTAPPIHDHVPEPISAPLDLPPIAPVVSQPPPAVFVPPIPGSPLPPFVTEEHNTDLPVVFRHEIPAPRRGEGTSRQPPSFNPFASADFPPIPQITPFDSDPFDQPFRWFPPYTMPISDPYHPSHHIGYTRDDLLLSLRLQFEILSRKVLELEFGEGARRCPFPSYPPSVPPPSSLIPFVSPSAAPSTIGGFDARFLTAEQQISYLVCRVHELEDELAHLRSLIFFPPPPPPPSS
ncbi:hypothetical protein HanXRQr2_Chr07g0287691 [Helianthus annuus]|uniref:Uncharacterized protein n=1 Tax=Helianthus annuus TaxID=4232 RepID=A0A9K3IJZ2_HELAN|nr:hypothetical protein HanXRQr2_Chr07g0287691 [Helianthus annuus]